MTYLQILPEELHMKIYKHVYDDSVKNIDSIEFFPRESKRTSDDDFRYCYVKKNNRVMLYCEYFSYGHVHTDLEYIYIDFTIHKSTYVINNSIMFYYKYAKRRYDIRDICRYLSIDIISNCLNLCGYSNSKRIIFVYEDIPIPVNVFVFFQKCMDDESIN